MIRFLISLCFLILATELPAAQAQNQPPGVIVSRAAIEPVVDRIEALGTLKALESVEISAVVSETVSAIHFDSGDRVKAGQTLVELSSDEEKALLEEARATVDEAHRQYERIQTMVSQGTAAESLHDERRRQWTTARARLTAIESRLADRNIRAPFAGVVGLRDISIGALVEPGDRITTLDDDSVMRLDVPVPDVYLPELDTGLDIVATTRAWGDRQFPGQVVAVNSRVDAVTRSIRVRVHLPNADYQLRPGMLMRVVVHANPRTGIVVPEEALLPLGERQYVLRVDASNDNRVSRDEVVIGARFPGRVEIIQGLSEGDLIITHGSQKARPGQPVVIDQIEDQGMPLSKRLQSLTAPADTAR